MAQEVRVGLATIQRWEAGESKPRGYNLERLGEVLGLSPELMLEIARPAHLPVGSFPQSESTKALQGFVKQDLTLHLWSFSSQSCRTSQEIHGAMVRILKDHENMNNKNHHITRRKALLRLIALPLATLGTATFMSEESLEPAKAKEVLMQCTVSIAACWELMKSPVHSDLSKTFNAISTYLPTLQRIARDSSEHRQEAAGLVTQCLLLKSKLGQHVEGIHEAIQYALQIFPYSQESKDVSLQLLALNCLALAYHYGRRYQQALQTIEQAIPLLEQKNIPVSPCLQARLNGALAYMKARNGQDETAHLDQAYKFFSESKDESSIYVDYEESSLLLDAGAAYLHKGDSAKAIATLSQIIDPETLILRARWSEVNRIETINEMTMALLKSKDRNMEQIIYFWTEGIQAARAIHSEQRFSEALTAYDIMQAIWPNEKRIRDLHDLIAHW